MLVFYYQERWMTMRMWCLVAMFLTVVPAVWAESLVLNAGSQVKGVWDSWRPPTQMQEEFDSYSLESAETPAPHVLWRFRTKTMGYADVFLRAKIEHPIAAIKVRAGNDSADLDLAVKIADANGAEWTAPPQRLIKGPAQTIRFSGADFAPATWSKDSDGRLDLPCRHMAVIAFGVKPGDEYALRLEQVEVEFAEPARLTAESINAPEKIKAGETFHYAARMTMVAAPGAMAAGGTPGAVELRLTRDGAVQFRATAQIEPADTPWAPGEVRDIKGDITVPEFAWGGAHEIRMALGGSEAVIETPQGISKIVAIDARKPGTLSSDVRPWRGAPTLFINDKPHSGMMYTTYNPDPKVLSDFAKAGVDLFSFAGTPTESAYGLARTCWTAPDVFDYSQFDERALMILEADSSAFFFPRLYLHAPQWWCDQHLDDMVLMDPGDGAPVPFLHNGQNLTPSWASDAWREDTAEGLRRFIAYVEASPFADRCIGYHLASGNTEEWMMWGENEDIWVDYSPANTQKFQRWLEARYKTVDALRLAWGDPALTFETARVPFKSARADAKKGVFRDTATERPSTDYYEYNSWLVADTISYFAAAVKEYAGRDRIVGAFYGYVLQLFQQRQQNAGHLALDQLWSCPDIDFLCSPTSYAFRDVGGRGTSHFMSLLQGLQRKGKLWFSETDIRTSLTAGALGEWGKPATIAEDCLQQDKDLANVLTHGAAQWWFDVGYIRYDDPVLMEHITMLRRVASENVAVDRRPVDEVAVVVDPRSLAFMKVNNPLSISLLLDQIPQLARMGAPFGWYTIGDLEALANKKLIIFLTCFAPTAEERQRIEALKGNGRTLVFVYAQGIYKDDNWDPAAMTSLTGIQLEATMEPSPASVTIGAAFGPALAESVYGYGQPTSPVVYCIDPDVVKAGVMPSGRCGLAIKEQGDWSSVFSAAPLLPAALLRELAKRASVHLYADTEDVVWASKGMLSLCVNTEGRRIIHLPSPARVMDLYSGKLVGDDLKDFQVDMTPQSTKLWRVEYVK